MRDDAKREDRPAIAEQDPSASRKRKAVAYPGGEAREAAQHLRAVARVESEREAHDKPECESGGGRGHGRGGGGMAWSASVTAARAASAGGER